MLSVWVRKDQTLTMPLVPAAARRRPFALKSRRSGFEENGGAIGLPWTGNV